MAIFIITTVFLFKKSAGIWGKIIKCLSSQLLRFMSRLLWEIFIITKFFFPTPTNDIALSVDLVKNGAFVWSIKGM